MCGRYYVDDETSREIRKILEQLDAKYENSNRKTGEIFPTNPAPILAAYNGRIEPELSVWGFPNFYKKGVIINARAESAMEKKTFRECLVNRRCVIPSNGFFEWDSNKKKYLFTLKGSDILYMAGIYNFYQDECRFVILTTEANESMAPVHNRMPVVLTEDDMERWILDQNSTSRILRQIPPLLSKTA
ncbi:MAG: Abasic site processing protein [Lachnoclostridium sp.]|jgi:putative SOS response-associated peptidase YedK